MAGFGETPGLMAFGCQMACFGDEDINLGETFPGLGEMLFGTGYCGFNWANQTIVITKAEKSWIIFVEVLAMVTCIILEFVLIQFIAVLIRV
ncbi:MAG: hypothetical protein EZS28_008548 [Streblomastix strix]|uniref:Uncharacterized protein n=1 Tax=Streblomastix strix TaxID=222440 RepID=A0A5J4WLS6_9EUKA|nr:MAG: hypothetical protein EZS28_008548 [Streblomastix strix]